MTFIINRIFQNILKVVLLAAAVRYLYVSFVNPANIRRSSNLTLLQDYASSAVKPAIPGRSSNLTLRQNHTSSAVKPGIPGKSLNLTLLQKHAFSAVKQGIPASAEVSVFVENRDQNDEALIEFVRKNVLEPPDQRPYNLERKEKDEREKLEAPELLLTKIFKGKRGGVFFEAGAYDGVTLSTTLMLEQNYNWTGLLVEGDPQTLPKLRTRHRKAWIAPVPISVYNYSEKLIIALHKKSTYLQPLGDVVRTFRCENKLYFNAKGKELKEYQSRKDCIPVDNRYVTQSFPLYTLLKAARFTEIDFFSLDVEAAEEQILQTLPFDKVHIKVAFIEVQVSNRTQLVNIMKNHGYDILTSIEGIDVTKVRWRDIVCVKKGMLEPGTYTTE